MSDIRLSRSHTLTAEERERVMSALAQYLVNTLKATVQQHKDQVTFKGAGFGGKVAMGPTTVEGTVQLGMMMKPLKGTITREIGKVLDQYLGVP
jgi:putative polyhydroxyalkanoate system protein